MAELIVFHVQAPSGAPIKGALLKATAQTLGPWSGVTNSCGDFQAFLGADHYVITISAPGYLTRVMPADLANSGIITIGLDSFNPPFKVAPRFWKANMCGIRIPDLPPVAGGSSDPSLFLSWFYHLYDAPTRGHIRAHMGAKGYPHWLMSWPDAQDTGTTPVEFMVLCQELLDDNFFPCPMLSAKPTSSSNVRDLQGTLENIMLVAPLLIGVVPLVCIGWELSLWLSPSDVQFLTNQIAPLFTPSGCRVYVHFQEGYPSFQQNGGTVADYWWLQQDKLTGILYQKKLSQNNAQFLDSISDCLQRFSGGWGMPDESGFGHPFDMVGLELTAQPQFNGQMTEAEGDAIGRLAINAPHVFGPNGVEAMVMGSGNGS